MIGINFLFHGLFLFLKNPTWERGMSSFLRWDCHESTNLWRVHRRPLFFRCRSSSQGWKWGGTFRIVLGGWRKGIGVFPALLWLGFYPHSTSFLFLFFRNRQFHMGFFFSWYHHRVYYSIRGVAMERGASMFTRFSIGWSYKTTYEYAWSFVRFVW